MKQNKNHKLGFTLLELLVVVLIIGILVAIALPQYKKVIFKSRVASLQQALASIKSAEERYYLVNSQYTTNASNLDIDITYEKTSDHSVFIYGKYFVIDLIRGSLTSNYAHAIDVYYCPNKIESWQDCAVTYNDFIYRIWLDNSKYPGKIECIPSTDIGTSLCQMLK